MQENIKKRDELLGRLKILKRIENRNSSNGQNWRKELQ